MSRVASSARSAFILLLLAIAAPLARAQPAAAPSGPPPAQAGAYNIVSLQAEAQREVDNDLMSAVLFAELSEPDSARLARSLNAAMNAALQAAAPFKTVRALSGAYQTYPVYDNRRRLTEWRGRAELRLDSGDFPAAAALIGELQSRLQVASITFSVSNAMRQRIQNELIAETIGAFRARAEIAQKALGGRGYRVRHLNVGTAFAGPQPLGMETRMEARAAPGAVAPPQLEAGVSRVTVTANGSVEVD
jgi:predicted secreted protein